MPKKEEENRSQPQELAALVSERTREASYAVHVLYGDENKGWLTTKTKYKSSQVPKKPGGKSEREHARSSGAV